MDLNTSYFLAKYGSSNDLHRLIDEGHASQMLNATRNPSLTKEHVQKMLTHPEPIMRDMLNDRRFDLEPHQLKTLKNDPVQFVSHRAHLREFRTMSGDVLAKKVNDEKLPLHIRALAFRAGHDEGFHMKHYRTFLNHEDTVIRNTSRQMVDGS